MLNINPLWITFGPIVVINLILGISLVWFAQTGAGKTHASHEAARRSRSRFLNTFFKEWWVWLTDPIALWFVKLRITPNLITMIGFALTCISAVLYGYGLFGYAGWLLVFAASFDIFDGRVARLTGRESRSGAFFDSVMDRFGEGVTFIGLAFFFRESWVLLFVVAGLIGSMLVSYTRARAEAVGVECKVGSMQRPERIVYLGVSSIFHPVATLLVMPFWPHPAPWLPMVAIVIVGVMTNATAVYRMLHVMNALDRQEKGGQVTLPQVLTNLTTPEGRVAALEWAREMRQRRAQEKASR